uniref:Uncharacterized protein n=1 Tax=Timema tahoe TaxID=61484 RepID=A0A7R9IIH8_9NEOP|nr:unnamed protein product [Timema tahoe]
MGCVDLWSPKVLRSGVGSPFFRLRIHKDETPETITITSDKDSFIFLADNNVALIKRKNKPKISKRADWPSPQTSKKHSLNFTGVLLRYFCQLEYFNTGASLVSLLGDPPLLNPDLITKCCTLGPDLPGGGWMEFQWKPGQGQNQQAWKRAWPVGYQHGGLGVLWLMMRSLVFFSTCNLRKGRRQTKLSISETYKRQPRYSGVGQDRPSKLVAETR